MIRSPAPTSDARPGWLAIAGPTASGKTALALALAQRWPVEIISVDSALVFRGMDIGTAKPSAAELASAPHHLIDIRDPLQVYSAAEFVRDATALLGQVRARGRLPLLVGGTMLYFKALFEGLDEMPAAQPERRAEIEAEASQLGWPALHAQLGQVDPVTAARRVANRVLAPSRRATSNSEWYSVGGPGSIVMRSVSTMSTSRSISRTGIGSTVAPATRNERSGGAAVSVTARDGGKPILNGSANRFDVYPGVLVPSGSWAP